MARQYPEVQLEIDRIETDLEVLAMKSAVGPPADLRKAILKSIDDNMRKIELGQSLKETKIRVLPYLTAASVLVAIMSSLFAFNYYNKWKNSEKELSLLVAQNQQMADNYDTVNEQIDQLRLDQSVMNDPRFVRIKLKGTESSPSALAQVYWDEESENVYLSLLNVPSLKSLDQQYQLWAIIDGQPVDAGVFEPDSDGLLKMKNISKGAAAFAVTIEPRGGSISPTLESMVVVGNV